MVRVSRRQRQQCKAKLTSASNTNQAAAWPIPGRESSKARRWWVEPSQLEEVGYPRRCPSKETSSVPFSYFNLLYFPCVTLIIWALAAPVTKKTQYLALFNTGSVMVIRFGGGFGESPMYEIHFLSSCIDVKVNVV